MVFSREVNLAIFYGHLSGHSSREIVSTLEKLGTKVSVATVSRKVAAHFDERGRPKNVSGAGIRKAAGRPAKKVSEKVVQKMRRYVKNNRGKKTDD